MYAPSLGSKSGCSLRLLSFFLTIPYAGWNRTLVRQLARTRNHTVRIKARVRARGVTGHQYFNERRTELCRAKARTQQVWSLQLAGDWFPAYETKVPALRPHYMRPVSSERNTPTAHQIDMYWLFLLKCIHHTIGRLSLRTPGVMLAANLAVKDRMANGTTITNSFVDHLTIET